MLRNYVNERRSDWDEYASALTYAYNNHVHQSTATTPFDLVLLRPPPAFSLYHNSRGNSNWTRSGVTATNIEGWLRRTPNDGYRARVVIATTAVHEYEKKTQNETHTAHSYRKESAQHRQTIYCTRNTVRSIPEMLTGENEVWRKRTSEVRKDKDIF